MSMFLTPYPVRIRESLPCQGPCGPLADAARRGEIELKALARGCYPGEPLPEDALPGLRSVGYWDAKNPQNWGLGWHRHEGLEIEFQETGKMLFAVDHQPPYWVDSGQLTLTRPWQMHRYGSPNLEVGRLHWIILDVGAHYPNQVWKWPSWLILTPEDLQTLTYLLRWNEMTVLQADRNVRNSFLKIAEAVETESEDKRISRLAVRINELLLNLLELLQKEVVELDENLSSSARATELFLKNLQEDQNAMRHPWTVRTMAAACGIGTTQFTNYCKLHTNQSPAEFLRKVRLEAAKELLEESPKAICQIAQECGFGSAEYFATTFRSEYGLSPKSYRQQMES